jgi:hypothetical protein
MSQAEPHTGRPLVRHGRRLGASHKPRPVNFPVTGGYPRQTSAGSRRRPEADGRPSAPRSAPNDPSGVAASELVDRVAEDRSTVMRSRGRPSGGGWVSQNDAQNPVDPGIPKHRQWDLEPDGLWLPKGGWIAAGAFGPLGGGTSGVRLARSPKRTSRSPGSGPQHCPRSV